MDGVVNPKSNNFLASLHFAGTVGLSLLDISTGEFLIAEGDIEYTRQVVGKFFSK